MNLDGDADFEQLLEYLGQNRGFDFRGYKRATLTRRVWKRVQQVGLTNSAEYLDYLQVHPDEFPVLFNTILINVTEFFRDPLAWDYVNADVIPRITRGEDPVRVWSAGCASGEEAYTVAMLLCEALGPDAYSRRVKVYATDVDEEALAKARSGYAESEMDHVPEEMRERYFEVQSGRRVFKAALRRAIIFGRHDLIQDAPISRLDLLVCRNTLMYFTAESQARILARFHYALKNDGYLFLGRAEMLLTHGNLFIPVDLKHRVFNKVQGVELRDRLLLLTQAGDQDAVAEATEEITRQVRLRELAADAVQESQVLLDASGTVLAINQQARLRLGLGSSDVGRHLQDLELSYRPIELRAPIEKAHLDRRPVTLAGVEHPLPDGSFGNFDILVSPLMASDGTLAGTSLAWTDVTTTTRLRGELENARQTIETAYEELQSTNEELETTNEELQSTVEELETTNEELQSSNEELETMNEELEATNTELQTINLDLSRRTEDVDRLNAFLESIVSGLGAGVAALDGDGRVTLWNKICDDLWGLHTEEVAQQKFFELDFGLPVDQLRDAVAAVQSGRQKVAEVVLDAANRRGRQFSCKVTMSALPALEGFQPGVVLVMRDARA
jgi:two-component system CheB/CheR fusion protein